MTKVYDKTNSVDFEDIMKDAGNGLETPTRKFMRVSDDREQAESAAFICCGLDNEENKAHQDETRPGIWETLTKCPCAACGVGLVHSPKAPAAPAKICTECSILAMAALGLKIPTKTVN